MANAAPSTPHLNPQTNKISRPILTNVEIIRKISGVIESPIALKSPAQTKKGIWQVTKVTWIWCAFMVVLSYTVVPYMVEMITATKTKQGIDTASL